MRGSFLQRTVGTLLFALLTACGGGRSENIGSECLVDASTCPSGTTCENGRCVDEEPTQAALSASARPEGAAAAIEWVAVDGVSCVQGDATTCTVRPGSKLTLKAPDVLGFRFAGWYGGPGCSASEPLLELVVRENVDCVARYVQRVRVTGTVDQNGGDVRANSDSPFARCTNGVCEVDRGATVTLDAPQRDGFRLSGWEGEGCIAEPSAGYMLTIAAERDTTCKANFVASLTVRGVAEGAPAAIRVSATASSARCVDQLCAVDPGDAVALEASMVDGFRFVGWSGHSSCTGSEAAISVMDVRESIACTANYVPRFSVRGLSSGTDPAAVIAASSSDAFALCNAEQCVVDQGGTVSLVAPTVAGYRLRGWSGEGCSVDVRGASTTVAKVQANATCTAEYVRGVAVSGTALGAPLEVVATSTSPGASCAAGSCTIDAGGAVTLSAPTPADRTFLGWSGDTGCSGTNPILSLQNVATSASCTARYAARYTIAGTAVPAELGAVVASSSAATARCAGASCSVDEGAAVALVATAGADARFVGWSGGGACTGSAARVELSNARANLTCRATFLARYTLTSAVTPTGSGTTVATSTAAQSVCNGGNCVVDAAADVNVQAVPETGFRFVGWSGCSNSTANPVVVDVTGPRTCTARMERLSFAVSASAGTGGSVSASIGDEVCAAATCVVPYGGSATLRAAAEPGYTFTGWSGCGTSTETPWTLTNVTRDQSCMASFTRMRFTVSATAGTGGSVTAATGNMSCADASCAVDFGATVTLQAAPATGYSFGGWSCGGTSPELVLTNITASRSCQAMFTLNSYAVSAQAGAGGSLRVTPGSGATCTGSTCTVTAGGTVAFDAVAGAGFAFDGWTCTVGAPTSSSQAALSFTNVTENHTCSASFRRSRFQVTIVGATGLLVQGTNGTVACPNNVCTVDEGGSISLLAYSSGTVPRIFTGWRGCAASTPTAVAGRTDLAFSSALTDIRSDQTCTAGSEALAVVTAYQDSGTGAPAESIDLLHVCQYGAAGPRESQGATICRVPITARVVFTARSTTGSAFEMWECWDETPNGETNNARSAVNPQVIAGLTANQRRACHAYFN